MGLYDFLLRVLESWSSARLLYIVYKECNFNVCACSSFLVGNMNNEWIGFSPYLSRAFSCSTEIIIASFREAFIPLVLTTKSF